MESLDGVVAANTLMDVDVASDEDSIMSSPEDYGIQEQECEDAFNDYESVTVACVMISDDASFVSSASSTVPNLSNMLQEILNINNDTTNDNDSFVHHLKSMVLLQIKASSLILEPA